MNKLYILLALTALASFAYATDCNDTAVTENLTLSDNYTYIGGGATGCLIVSAPDVTINCDGYSITGDATGEEGGRIAIYSDQNKTQVLNCIINWTGGKGINIVNIGYAIINNTNITTNGDNAESISFEADAHFNEIHNSNFHSITASGISYDASDYNTISDTSSTSDAVAALGVYSTHNTFNHLTLTGTSDAYALDMELGGNDGFNVFGNSTMTSNGSAVVFLNAAPNNTFDNITVVNEVAVSFGLLDSAQCSITNSNILSGTDGIAVFLGSTNGNFSNNIIVSTGGYCFNTQDSGDTYLGNNCTSDLWVNDSSVGGNTFNDSTSGNIWNFANGTPSWAVYATAVVGAPGWATSGTVPFNATNTPTEWSGVSGDFHPWTGNEYVTPPIPPTPINVNYTNYSTPNVTGFGSAFDYSKTVMTTATGWADAFGLMVLGTIFICFYIIGSRYTQERALVYSMFMVVVVAFLMVSGNFLDPKWLILSIVGLLASVYFAGRVSQ